MQLEYNKCAVHQKTVHMSSENMLHDTVPLLSVATEASTHALCRRKNAFPNSYDDIMMAQAGATLITRGTIPENTYVNVHQSECGDLTS